MLCWREEKEVAQEHPIPQAARGRHILFAVAELCKRYGRLSVIGTRAAFRRRPDTQHKWREGIIVYHLIECYDKHTIYFAY